MLYSELAFEVKDAKRDWTIIILIYSIVFLRKPDRFYKPVGLGMVLNIMKIFVLGFLVPESP